MTMAASFFAMFLAAAATAAAPAESKERDQTIEQSVKDATIQVGFVIAKSTADYAEALTAAKLASRTLRLPLKLRDLSPHKKTGLTYPRADCEREFGEFPCYFARGRFDSGAYVSIEHSNAYAEFSPNLFIVILASGEKKSALLRSTLEKAQKAFPEAYVKTAGVYMGCMH